MKSGSVEKFPSAAEGKPENEIKVSAEVKELELPCLDIVYDLRDQLESGAYGTIIGDDASGRIPTLIISRAIDKIYEKNGEPHPRVLFLAGGRQASKAEKIVAYLREAMARGKLDPSRKALLVTDYLVTGDSISPILSALSQVGIEYHIASISSTKKENYWNASFKTRVVVGMSDDAPAIYSKQSMSGIIKSPSEVISRSIKKEIPAQSGSAKDFQKRVNDTRADAFTIADSVYDLYEKRTEDDKQFLSEESKKES